MELTGIFPILRRWIGVIIMATVVAAGAGFGIGVTSTSTYEAEVVMLVGPLATDQNTQRASGQQALTYAELVQSAPIKAEAAKVAQLPKGATKSVRATANQTTRFITITVRNANPESAANLANALAEVMKERTKATPDNPARPEGQLVVTDNATAPSTPVAPRLELIVPLAAMAGLLGALTLVLLIEYLSDTAKSAEEVAVVAGVPCLAAIKSRSGRLLVESRNHHAVDDYRLLATQLDLAAQHLRCVLVLGVDEGDGAGTVATNLATIYADRRDPVTLIDGGPREVTTLAGLSSEPGLSEAVRSPQSSLAVARHPGRLPFGVVSTGLVGRLEAVRQEDAERVVDLLTAAEGLVVVHAAAPMNSPAALVWARVADVTILCVRRQRTHRASLTQSVEHLRTVGANLLGTVLHEVVPVVTSRSEAPAAPPVEVMSVPDPDSPAVLDMIGPSWLKSEQDQQARKAAGTHK